MEFIIENAAIIGLIFFVTVFIIILIYLFVFGNKEKFDSYAKIPLDTDEEND